MKNIITLEHLRKSLTYDEYESLIENLVSQNKTSGPDQSKKLVDSTKLNLKRLKRWDKTIIPDEVMQKLTKQIKNKFYWFVLVEAWCGDGAQNLPYINKIADLTENIELKILLRDENPDVMDKFLTDGKRSIPKLIILQSDNLDLITTWGPRPLPAQLIADEYKKSDTMTEDEFKIKLHKWYAEDKQKSLSIEIKNIIEKYLL